MEKLGKGIFLFALVFLFGVLSFTVAFGQEIKIGIAGPMAFEQGRQQWFGAEFGADEINAKGGILVGSKRMPIKLVKIDTNEILNVPDAASAIERAITRDKVDFLMGGFRTEAVLAMQDVAMDYKKIFIGCGAAHPELCGRVGKDYNKYKYWFRTTPINSLFLLKVDLLLVGTVADAIRKELGITTPKVAIVAEKAVWADPIVGLGKTNLPKMGMEVVGEWRPSSTATDLTAELSAINASGAQMIFTTLSGPVGIPYAKTWGELKIPAASVGINVEAQKKGFLGATGGMGNYEMTQNTLARVEITPATIPFYDKFAAKAGEFPTYNAGTNDAILILAAAIERAGTLDSDKVVVELEKTNFLGAAGRIVFTKEHDVTWGPGYVTAMGTQWQFGELMGVWPYKWKATPEAPEITYKGVIPYKIPPWVVQKWKK
jgi:branched-chain amino acid transport system substrate-binding protein